MSADSSTRPRLAKPWCTAHQLTAHDHAVMTQMLAMAAPNKGKMRGVEARPAFDALIQHTAAPEGVIWRADQVGGVPGWWCEPMGAPRDVAILHLHGGWFNWGSAKAYRHLSGHIARSAAANTFIPDYRLAPEHPFPAGGDDAKGCFDGLLSLGFRAIAVTGDSAGGNLALGLLTTASGYEAARAGRLVGAAVLSPVTDLTLSGASWTNRADGDPFFVRDQAAGLVGAYLDGHDAADALVSPLFGVRAGLPPLRVHVGDHEVLLDDSVNYVHMAVAAGVDAEVDVWAGMAHGFVGSVGRLEAADAALKALGDFLSPLFSKGCTQGQ